MSFGIEAIEFYAPRTYVDQKDLEKHHGVGEGKYTKGLGQLQLAFAIDSEDVNSLALTVVNNLMKNNNLHPSQIGRLEVGTETLVDKSKSTKTVLMSLFQGYHDIEGATSINACYGATNALINTLNWVSSASWDGRYGIVVAVDIAVYEDGPARPTGGAGAIAMLIGKNAKITISPIRSTFIDNQWDFYKPVLSSEYPTVDGKFSTEIYLKSVRECFLKLKEKNNGKNPVDQTDYYLFHCPFGKMVQKAFEALMKVAVPGIKAEEITQKFNSQVDPTLYLNRRYGNIYTGSVYLALLGLLIQKPDIKNKKALLFSYGSGLCSSFLQLQINQNIVSPAQIQRIEKMMNERVQVTAAEFTRILLEKEKKYGNFKGVIPLNQNIIGDNVYYLSEIDSKWRRYYKLNQNKKPALQTDKINFIKRIPGLDSKMSKGDGESKFHKLTVDGRIATVEDMTGVALDREALNRGGITTQNANSMIENVIGKISLPLGVVPAMKINEKEYMIPMCIEEPSVVAAVSSIAKLLGPYGIKAFSTQNLMVGQVYLPDLELASRYQLEKKEKEIISMLNEECKSMVSRGGGVKRLSLREIRSDDKAKAEYSLDITIDVCDAMGANITNTISEKAKEIINSLGIKTGISILSNYCVNRRAISTFKLPVSALNWKGVGGEEVAKKIIEAYNFARHDKFRAVTHNKGIMNGIDAVCLATGQDWRAVESAAHAFAIEKNKDGLYGPLTHYEIVEENGNKFFKGSLELPISVGTVGGSVNRNTLYSTNMNLMGNPSAQELSQIIVSVGLCQNLAALRALAIEGIQKGHMKLHARAIATKAGVPAHLIDECCKFMQNRKKYDGQTIQAFLEFQSKPKL